MAMLNDATFWLGLLKIIWINILLSGENAVAIALAARGLQPSLQKKVVLLGSGAAVVLRIALTVVAAKLLSIEGFQIAGGVLLLWIGVQLLDENNGKGGEVKQHGSLIAAVRTILFADLVMSLDNVIGVAAAAQGNFVLLALGLALSIPIVVFGSTLVMQMMHRWPVIVTLGAGLIGWIAGETIASDAMFARFILSTPLLHYGGAALGTVFVLLIGLWLAKRPAQ